MATIGSWTAPSSTDGLWSKTARNAKVGSRKRFKMTKPYVFIVGCARSGTTLLRRIVNAHGQIAIMPESHWIDVFFEERTGLTPEGMVTPALIDHLLEHRKFARLHFDRPMLLSLLQSGQPVSYADFVARIFELYGKREGKSLVGDKTPAYVRRLHQLHALWPAARFVHLIRDGRDVCLSMAKWKTAHVKKPGIFTTWKDDSVSTTALWWELNVRSGQQAGHSLGPKLYYELRYESLLCNPAEECAALCTFLGLPYDDAMLRFHEGRTKTNPGLDAKHAWLPITPGLRNWRSQMPTEDVERFEAATGDLLDELGYPRAVPSPRSESLEHAARTRDLLAHDPNWRQMVPRSHPERLQPASIIPDSRTGNLGTTGSFEGRS